MIHGQTKKKHIKSQQELTKAKEISDRVSKALNDFLKLRKGQIDVQDPMQVTNNLLKLCPQIPTIYNYRIEQILINKKKLQPAHYNKMLDSNILMTSKLLRENPKSYTIWNFRQWLVLQHQKGQLFDNCIKSQLALTQKMLKQDQRNFHVWNYRNWLNQCSTDIQRQLKFIDTKLQQNPSNFSAYHFKIKHYTTKYRQISTQSNEHIFSIPQDLYLQQLKNIKQIIYIDGKQYGPWRYYQWLLNLLIPITLIKIQYYKDNIFILTFNKSISSPAQNLGIKQQKKQGYSMNWNLYLENNQLGFIQNQLGNIKVQGQFGGKLVQPCQLRRKENSWQILQSLNSQNKKLYKLKQQQLEFLKEVQDNEQYSKKIKSILQL